jgi:hypothetical protein
MPVCYGFRTPAMLVGRWFPFQHQLASWYGKFTRTRSLKFSGQYLLTAGCLPAYAKHGSTALGSVVLWGSVPTLWLADADGIKTVAAEATVFQKDVVAVSAFNYPFEA